MHGTWNFVSERSRRIAGAVFLTLSLLAVAVGPAASLKAKQDEPETPEAAGQSLPRPRDMNAETLDQVSTDLQARIAVIWDASQSAENRKQAIADAQPLIAALTGDSAKDSLRGRLQRRIGLIEAAMKAAAVDNLQPSQVDYQGRLHSAVTALTESLNSVPNGNLWIAFLKLDTLSTPDASADAIKAMIERTTPTDEMSSEQRAFVLRPDIQELKSHAESAAAALMVFENDAAARVELDKQIDHLLRGILQNEVTPVVSSADKVRVAWRVIRARFPAAADTLRPVLNEHYFNNNLHLSISETLMARLISDYKTETGRVSDCILGAWVTGTQTTNVHVSVDVQPSTTTAKFDLKLDGNTKSDTVAQKDPATIWTTGNHYFWIDKAIEFNGSRIITSPSRFSVDTNSRTLGFRTKFDGIPLFGGIVRSMARQKIAESKPESEAETARRLRKDAVPKFDTEASNRFGTLDEDLQKTHAALEAKGVAPDSVSARSSNTHVAVSSRTIGSSFLGGSVQPVAPLATEGGTIQVHESTLNGLLDALAFHGRVIPDDQLTPEIEKAMSALLQRDIKLKNGEQPAKTDEDPEHKATSFVFSKADPLRVRFDNGELTLLLQTGIRQEGRADVAVHTIIVPIAVSVAESKIVLTPKPIRVVSAPITVANQLRKVIGRRIQAKELEATTNLQADSEKPLTLTITGIQLNDGWLTTEFK
ncbi:MAG: hypothetical protein WCK86_14620 [Planctomycetia bacterium]